MQFVGKVISSVSEFYKDINPATLSGAIDVIVVEDAETGELACSPFHVRFGKLQLLRPQEKAVDLVINGVPLGERLRMKVGEAGETFFVLPREGGPLAAEYMTSPLPRATLPVPLDNVEELRLQSGVCSGDEQAEQHVAEMHITEITTTVETRLAGTIDTTDPVAASADLATVTQTTTMFAPGGVEWKWEWGDLPMKQEPHELIGVSEVITVQPLNVTNEEDVYGGRGSSLNAVAEDGLLHKEHVTSDASSSSTGLLNFAPVHISLAEYLKRPRVLNRMLLKLKDNPKIDSIRVYRLLNKRLIGEESEVDEESLVQMDAVALEHACGSLDSADLLYCFNDSVYVPNAVGVQITLQWSVFKTINVDSLLVKEDEEGEEPDGGVVVDEQAAEHERHVDVHSDLTAETKEAITSPDSEIATTTTDASTAFALSSTSLAAPTQTAPATSSWRAWWSRKDASNTNHPHSSANGSPGSVGSLTGKNSASSYDVPSMNLPHPPGNRSASPTPSAASILSASSSIGENAINYNSSYASLPSGASAKQYIKSLRLPSETLKSLNLKPGVNTVSYSVTTKLQGTATCHSRIFLWHSTDRIVISDIDGTITKSDALGHLFTMVGKDWTHVGVASLFTKIAANGYQFMYLTSRAIGQAASTRGYLKGVEQDRYQLPDGPVIMSPDRLFTALHREVIQRRPDQFKISCLRDIQRLFQSFQEDSSDPAPTALSSSSEDEGEALSSSFVSSDDELSSIHSHEGFMLRRGRGRRVTSRWNNTNESAMSFPSSMTTSALLTPFLDEAAKEKDGISPFYAGFGNRPTDTRSYKAVGIPASRIFIINSAGDLKLDTMLTFYTPYSTSSYLRLTEMVDKVFPPLTSPSALTRVAGEEAFSDFQYWHSSDGGSVRMDLVEAALASVGRESGASGKFMDGTS